MWQGLDPGFFVTWEFKPEFSVDVNVVFWALEVARLGGNFFLWRDVLVGGQEGLVKGQVLGFFLGDIHCLVTQQEVN